MTEAAINPLRRRMIEDMTVRNLSEGTQRSTSDLSRPAAGTATRSHRS